MSKKHRYHICMHRNGECLQVTKETHREAMAMYRQLKKEGYTGAVLAEEVKHGYHDGQDKPSV